MVFMIPDRDDGDEDHDEEPRDGVERGHDPRDEAHLVAPDREVELLADPVLARDRVELHPEGLRVVVHDLVALVEEHLAQVPERLVRLSMSFK
jgi:hypothetical protein